MWEWCKLFLVWLLVLILLFLWWQYFCVCFWRKIACTGHCPCLYYVCLAHVAVVVCLFDQRMWISALVLELIDLDLALILPWLLVAQQVLLLLIYRLLTSFVCLACLVLLTIQRRLLRSAFACLICLLFFWLANIGNIVGILSK